MFIDSTTPRLCQKSELEINQGGQTRHQIYHNVIEVDINFDFLNLHFLNYFQRDLSCLQDEERDKMHTSRKRNATRGNWFSTLVNPEPWPNDTAPVWRKIMLSNASPRAPTLFYVILYFHFILFISCSFLTYLYYIYFIFFTDFRERLAMVTKDPPEFFSFIPCGK